MDEFNLIMTDLCVDMKTTFPELTEKLDSLDKESCYKHCLSVYPPRMIDIIYKDMSIFDKDFYILPEIDLSPLMKSNISDNTRTIIWKYLLLILGTTTNKKDMNKVDLMEKLKESLKNDETDEYQEKIKSVMDGKIGSIAKEMAEEATKKNPNPEDFMKNLFQDPSKLMDMAKDIETKLDGKFKNGELNQDDLQKELMSTMNTLKDLPGLKEMLNTMNVNPQKKGKTKRKQQRKRK